MEQAQQILGKLPKTVIADELDMRLNDGTGECVCTTEEQARNPAISASRY